MSIRIFVSFSQPCFRRLPVFSFKSEGCILTFFARDSGTGRNCFICDVYMCVEMKVELLQVCYSQSVFVHICVWIVQDVKPYQEIVPFYSAL